MMAVRVGGVGGGVGGGRWEVGGGRWEVKGGGWEVGGRRRRRRGEVEGELGRSGRGARAGMNPPGPSFPLSE